MATLLLRNPALALPVALRRYQQQYQQMQMQMAMPVREFSQGGQQQEEREEDKTSSKRGGGAGGGEQRNGRKGRPTSNSSRRPPEEASAYEVLGLPEICSDPERICAAFRELAKATHPDLQMDTSTARFIRILAAYEILSDPAKRVEYDRQLKSKREAHQNQQGTSSSSGFAGAGRGGPDDDVFHSSGLYEKQSRYPMGGSTEVVSWLRGYRAMVKDVINRHEELGAGRGRWEDELRNEVQSALKRAYFGPPVREQEGLPECFEAEERAQPEVEDVLHLVSGRQLFGVVRQVQSVALEGQQGATPALLEPANALEEDHRHHHDHHDLFDDTGQPGLSNSGRISSSSTTEDAINYTTRHPSSSSSSSSAVESPVVSKSGEGTSYDDLELQLFGNVVARSIRVPFQDSATGSSPSSLSSSPSSSRSSTSSLSENATDGQEDCIYIYLSSEQVECPLEFAEGRISDESQFSRILLGTIRGLGSWKAGGAQNVCFAHGPDGRRTHLILQHSTPLVKHMQWFRVGEENAACECRCRRASTLPSRYWIFEPRADTHDVGGWYIETFDQSARFQKGSSSRRMHRRPSGKQHSHEQKTYGDSKGTSEGELQNERPPKLLHPAMVIMAAAYRTLDEERKVARKKEASIPKQIKNLVDFSRITSGFTSWWKQK